MLVITVCAELGQRSVYYLECHVTDMLFGFVQFVYSIMFVWEYVTSLGTEAILTGRHYRPGGKKENIVSFCFSAF
jgi:hypothetical protein